LECAKAIICCASTFLERVELGCGGGHGVGEDEGGEEEGYREDTFEKHFEKVNLTLRCEGNRNRASWRVSGYL
jgi:hypothetical protein